MHEGKLDTRFCVRQLNEDKKQIILNSKYEVGRDFELFDTIDFLVDMINEKNSIEKKKFPPCLSANFFSSVQFMLAKAKMQEEKCPICIQEFAMKNIEQQVAKPNDEDIYVLGCSHKYHRACLNSLLGDKQWIKCAVCGAIFGKMLGDQPQGKIQITVNNHMTCLGHPPGTIVINYVMHAGERNQKKYPGTKRTAYLPNTQQGREVRDLLKEAFERKLIFTVGRSVTTGLDNQIVWNGIHHKTNLSGGAAHFGYPDETYLKRVKEELTLKGIIR